MLHSGPCRKEQCGQKKAMAVLLSDNPCYLFVRVDLERALAVDQLVRLDLALIEQPYALLSHRSHEGREREVEVSQAVSSTAPQGD